MVKNRYLVDILKTRLKEPAPLIQVLVGPRQIGKTVALKTVLEDLKGIYQTADFPTPMPSTRLEEWWKQALDSTDKILGIDEIQKVKLPRLRRGPLRAYFNSLICFSEECTLS